MVDDRLDRISKLLSKVYQAFSDLYEQHGSQMDEETNLKLKAAEDSAQSMEYDELRHLLLDLYARSKENLEE